MCDAKIQTGEFCKRINYIIYNNRGLCFIFLGIVCFGQKKGETAKDLALFMKAHSELHDHSYNCSAFTNICLANCLASSKSASSGCPAAL